MSRKIDDSLQYLSGFGNELHSEDARCPDSLPTNQSSPQKCPYNLYAEQLSGTAFTVPRTHNRRSWLYRIRPSVMHLPFAPYEHESFSRSGEPHYADPDPNQLRWHPFNIEKFGGERDFVDGLRHVAGAGNATVRHGANIYVYCCTKSMTGARRVMCDSDGDLLIVPQQGALRVRTEFGRLLVQPNEICVIMQGMRFAVDIEADGSARGYVLEVYDGHFELPNLGPIGKSEKIKIIKIICRQSSFLGAGKCAKLIGKIFFLFLFYRRKWFGKSSRFPASHRILRRRQRAVKYKLLPNHQQISKHAICC